MQLKNKSERENFLDNYKSWELWKEIPELELKFYRKELPNGTQIIATEYASMIFAGFEKGRCKYEKGCSVKYHLLLSKSDNYNTGTVVNDFKLYNPSGDSKSDIINYLTQTRPEV